MATVGVSKSLTRSAGTHVKNAEFTTQKKKVRPELVSGMSVASLGLPPELITCTEGSWGAYVVVQEFLHGTNKYEPTDAVAKCKRFLDIVRDLVAKFE